MKTWNRICIKDYEITAKNGDYCKINRGKEYTTSDVADGEVVVFTNYWIRVPIDHFAGEGRFT